MATTMESVLLMWILCIVWIKGIHSVQQFELLPGPLEVNPGETATLTCKVRDRRGECAWLKDGKVMGRIEGKYDFLREPTNGDCSIRIRNSRLEEDDGFWQCQVTQTSLLEPTLTSPDVKFTVREPPIAPRIEDNTNVLPAGESYPAQAGKPKRLHCISRRGNPPALLRWFIEDNEITAMANQSNVTDVDKPKTWQAISVLDYVFRKEHNGKALRCVALHPAYETLAKEIRLPLEVLYIPEIRLEGEPRRDIEEGEAISVQCIADANPPANVIWKKSGYSSIYALTDHLDFRPAKRSDSGLYSCSASNDVGQSPELQVYIDVKYKPQILKIFPTPGVTVSIYNSTTLLCEAEGNPPPKYSWLQRMGGDPIAWQQRGNNASLHIQNITYQYQGQYVCEVTNVINGHQYKATSSEISVDVTGAPQVQSETGRTHARVIAEKEEDAIIIVYFCADPSPRRAIWEWGSLKLSAGQSHANRYFAEQLQQDEKQKDCFEARLIIRGVDGSDSRRYTLNIENDRGKEAFSVMLEVKEPVAVSVVIGIVVGSIVLLVIITLIILYLLKAERMCFNRRRFEPTNYGDQESDRCAELIQNGRQGTEAIPPDALYTAINKKDSKNGISGVVHEKSKDNQNKNHNPEFLVYASLDLPPQRPQSKKSSAVKCRQSPVLRNRTEYAEIYFSPKTSEPAEI